MRRGLTSILAILTAFAAAAAGRADFDVLLPNGAKVTAAHASGAEVHVYRLGCPAGAKLTATAKSAKGAPGVALLVRTDDGSELGTATGTKPAVKNVVAVGAPTFVEVRTGDGTATGEYGLTIAWKSPKSFKGNVVIDDTGNGYLTFSADAGAVVSLSLKAPKGAATVPVFASVIAAAGGETALPGGSKASLTVGAAGTFTVRLTGAEGASASVSAKVKAPKSSKTSYRILPDTLPADAQVLRALTVASSGGLLEIDSGPLAGTSVEVPAGGFSAPTTLFAGSSPSIAADRRQVAASPTVFIGPEGYVFPSGRTATIRIPISAEVSSDGTSSLHVLTRDAQGQVTEITGVTYDTAANTATFAVSHFSSFQVVRDFHIAETQRLLRAGAASSESAGQSVAVEGDIAVVGAPGVLGPGNAAQSGVVTAYHRTGVVWTLEDEFSFESQQPFVRYGSAVAVSGTRFVAGAPGRNSSAGTAFVFARDPSNGWGEESELLVGQAAGDDFGATVDIDGDTVIVGAPGTASTGTQVGAAYVFVRDLSLGWTLQQTLAPDTNDDSQFFGASVAVSGDTAIVGTESVGAAYVFRRTGGTWALAEKLGDPEHVTDSHFGATVAIDGSTIAIASNLDAADGPGTGTVHLFDDKGTSIDPVVSIGGASLGIEAGSVVEFGRSIALKGTLLVVGAPSSNVAYPGGAVPQYRGGNAFVFQRIGSAWVTAAKLRGTSTDQFVLTGQHGFGRSVSIDGTTILAGSPGDDAAAQFAGAAFVFDVSGN